MNNQTNSSNSKFQMPQAPQPQHVQSESLLFNDISEEINADMRNKLHDFLQVLPYRTFKMELANFFKHIDRLKKEAEQNGTNISRLTNCSQMVPSNSRPCTSFRAPSTMSLISCNRNNTIRQPESNFQSIPLNSFKPSVHIELESNEVVLPRSNQSNHVSQSSSNMDTTIIKVSHRKNNIAKTKGNHKHLNPPETVFKNTFDPNDAYSNIKLVVENKSAFASHQNKNINNGCYSIDSSLLETVGLSNKNKTTKSDANGNNGKCLEKYLSKWSVNMKIIKSKKSCVLLTGTLLKADQSTVEEEHHNADLIICRKEKDLLKTNNGLYRLLGKIIGGSPDELYQESLSKNGFPVKWKILVEKYSCFNDSNKKSLLNFSLDSPISATTSMKPIKKPVNLDMSITRTGKIYNLSIIPLKKRKKFDDEISDGSKINYATFNRKLPLIASTPKIPNI